MVFRASSLLFVDGGGAGQCDVRMIDFAHSHSVETPQRDEGYIHGLRTLLSMLRQLQ